LAANKVTKEALDKAGLSISIDDLNYVISTGYARESIEFANRTVTEILCHAKGAYFMIPSTRFIIDMYVVSKSGTVQAIELIDTQRSLPCSFLSRYFTSSRGQEQDH
jgi:hypothetical protein